MELLQTIIFCLVIFFSTIGYGYIFYKITNVGTLDSFNLFINGIFFIIFLSLLINFFLPLNIYITNAFLVITSIVGLLIYLRIKIYLTELIFYILFSSLIIFVSYPYDDYNLYHLPYIQILNEFKIIFGLSNLHFRFGHSSILQNVSALFNNSFMLKDSFVFITPLLVSLLIVKSFNIFLKGNNKFTILLSFIFLFYFLIHGNRYGSLGNDYPSHGLAILVFLLFLELFERKDKEKINIYFYQILSLSVICFLSKLSFLLIFIFPFLIIIKNLKKIRIYKRYFLFFLSTLTFFFIKNFINTSCIIFPIFASCYQTDWLPNKYSEYSAAYVSVVSEAAVKDYQNSKMFYANEGAENFINLKKNKNQNIYDLLNNEEKTVFTWIARYEYYNKIKNWINPYLNNHFYNVIIKKLSPFILVIILINIIYLITSGSNKKPFKFIFYEQRAFFYLVIINLVFIIFWFFKFPIVRYGISFILVIVTFITSFTLLFHEINNERFKKYLKKIIFVILIYSISENFVRIYNYDKFDNYSKNIVPLENFKYQNFYKDKLIINLTETVCGSIEPICINKREFKRFDDEFIIKEKYGYKFILNKRYIDTQF